MISKLQILNRTARAGALRLLAFCFLLSAFRVPLRASEVVELNPDLGYLRIHSIVNERETLRSALQQPRGLVLDLRYPIDERDAGETLRQEFSSHPARTRLYVLVSPATPVPVVGVIAASTGRLVTLGVKGSRPEPQVVVAQSADNDRRAHDALASGTPLAELISGKIEKERYDEASLVEEFKNGNHAARPPNLSPTGLPGNSPPKANEPPVRLTDRVLQRAVHLHRALQALKL